MNEPHFTTNDDVPEGLDAKMYRAGEKTAMEGQVEIAYGGLRAAELISFFRGMRDYADGEISAAREAAGN